jgi:P pilus assembly chaperone PapD
VDKEAIPVSVDTNNTVIPPFGKKTYKLKHSLPQISDVEWQSINDFGLSQNHISTACINGDS